MTKIDAARQEYKDWSRLMGVETLSKLNETLAEGRGIWLINLCEARQERRYVEAADAICGSGKRIIMMSGPSSSGKTSSSLRIAQQCRVLGIFPRVLELDNYFVERDRTPRDENGEYDFESIGAMDTNLLQDNIKALLEGREVVIPKYNFKEGRTEFDPSRTMRLAPNELLFMEGIHALNPALIPDIDRSDVFNIYISALSVLNPGLTEIVHNSTTDKRLLRRIVRDNRTRGISPEDNILRWPSVRRGEQRNIFPYEENADVVFNSSTLYDVPLLKYYAEPLLHEVSESSPAYGKAQELLRFLDPITALKPAEIAAIPPTSIMREFIGGQILV
ncbi:MAG: nucleoside kinase [Bacteroidales bacterium]|nr:nucleoside kinase [Bacteroidales bacterium]